MSDHKIIKGSYLCDCCLEPVAAEATGVKLPKSAAARKEVVAPRPPTREFFIARARRAKAERLADYLADQGVTARKAASMSRKRWLAAAKKAGTHPPSEHTTSTVVSLLADKDQVA